MIQLQGDQRKNVSTFLIAVRCGAVSPALRDSCVSLCVFWRLLTCACIWQEGIVKKEAIKIHGF